MQNPFADLLSALVMQAPTLVAYIIGLVICMLRWNHSPRPAQLAFLGTSFLLIAAVGTPIVNIWIRNSFQIGGNPRISELFSMVGVVSGVVRATGYGFLIGAVFFGRGALAGGFPMASVTASPPPLPRG